MVKVYLVEFECSRTGSRIFHPESLNAIQAVELARVLKNPLIKVVEVNPNHFCCEAEVW